MAKANARLDAARRAYREALEIARRSPTSEAWTNLLAAGKELSAAEGIRPRRRGRRSQEREDRSDPDGETIEGLE